MSDHATLTIEVEDGSELAKTLASIQKRLDDIEKALTCEECGEMNRHHWPCSQHRCG